MGRRDGTQGWCPAVGGLGRGAGDPGPLRWRSAKPLLLLTLLLLTLLLPAAAITTTAAGAALRCCSQVLFGGQLFGAFSAGGHK